MTEMKRALLVGIDVYSQFSNLSGCVADATKMRDMLRWHENGESNYECRLFTSKRKKPITRELLTKEWNNLFHDFKGDILFYYSGHGAPTQTHTHLATQDGSGTIPGLAMNDLLQLANDSEANEVVLILDCCYSGALGDPANLQRNAFVNHAQLRKGVTILAASSPRGVAKEIEGQGVFTELLLSALAGGAADVRGYVSAASMYAYVDQALGAWDQRPMYKSYTSRMTPIRCCNPHVPNKVLKDLPTLFKKKDSLHCLRPSYEHTSKWARPEKVEVFNKFKLLRDARLLRTVGGEDLFYAALGSKPVQLTPLGQFYWRLAKNDRF